MPKAHAEAVHMVETTNRMGLKAPGILTFIISMTVMLAVMFAKYFNATIPGLTGEATQFTGLLVAYAILMIGCLVRGF